MNTQIDKFDSAILTIVQQNNRLTTEAIAEQVGLSAAAVQRRLKVLRETGVIAADVSVVAQETVGKPITLIVQISLERERIDLFNQFKQRMKQNPHVQQCYYVTGSADFIVILTASNMEEYEAFTQQYFFEDSNIKSFCTNVVLNRIKTGQTVSLEAVSASNHEADT